MNRRLWFMLKLYRTLICPLGARSFMFIHALCLLGLTVGICLWSAILRYIDLSGGLLLSIVGIYLALIALIEDARRDYNSQRLVRIYSNLSEIDWEIIAAIRQRIHRISDIELYVSAKLHASRAEAFRSLASLLKRGYIISDTGGLKYFLAPTAPHERREG